MCEPRLANPRRAEHRHQPWPRFGTEQFDLMPKQRKLGVPADEACSECEWSPLSAVRRAEGGHLPGWDVLIGLELVALDRVRCRCPGPSPDDNQVGRRTRQESLRGPDQRPVSVAADQLRRRRRERRRSRPRLVRRPDESLPSGPHSGSRERTLQRARRARHRPRAHAGCRRARARGRRRRARSRPRGHAPPAPAERAPRSGLPVPTPVLVSGPLDRDLGGKHRREPSLLARRAHRIATKLVIVRRLRSGCCSRGAEGGHAGGSPPRACVAHRPARGRAPRRGRRAPRGRRAGHRPVAPTGRARA